MGDEALRVSDREREQVAGVLARAQGEGRLELAEFDERVRAAYAATTRAELAPLTVDLPAEPAVPARAEVADRAARPPRGRRPHVEAVAWATVSALNLGIWAVVALAAPGPVHPWWIWVAGPWGAMLVLRALAERSGVARALPAPIAAVGLPCGVRRPR